MGTKKYASLESLKTFLNNLKDRFAVIGHTHKLEDITDYQVDEVLSSDSTNSVQNKVINAEFEAMSTAMMALDAAIDTKADISHTHENFQNSLDEINNAVSQKTQVQIITWEADD